METEGVFTWDLTSCRILSRVYFLLKLNKSKILDRETLSQKLHVEDHVPNECGS